VTALANAQLSWYDRLSGTHTAVFKLPEPPADAAALAGWASEVRRANYCAHPVRLAGRVDQADKRTGEVREASSTEGGLDGVLLRAVRQPRASVCPACAEVYRRTPGI
jgi:hypothetical protein